MLPTISKQVKTNQAELAAGDWKLMVAKDGLFSWREFQNIFSRLKGGQAVSNNFWKASGFVFDNNSKPARPNLGTAKAISKLIVVMNKTALWVSGELEKNLNEFK